MFINSQIENKDLKKLGTVIILAASAIALSSTINWN